MKIRFKRFVMLIYTSIYESIDIVWKTKKKNNFIVISLFFFFSVHSLILNTLQILRLCNSFSLVHYKFKKKKKTFLFGFGVTF